MSATLRIDKWLWFARFCKTRSLAQTLVTDGRVSVNDEQVKKANRLVRPGDRIEVIVSPVKRTVTIVALGTRRGPATEATLLYEESNPPERLDGDKREAPFYRPAGAGRPTKRDRRLLEQLFARAGSD